MIIAPRVVAVDDNPEHLEILANGFDSLGGYCLGIEHDKVVERSGPFATGVRLIFMDINLVPGAGTDRGARTFEPIVNAIQKILHPDNGPYVLVTWTNTPDSHNELIEYLANTNNEMLQPCADCCLAKEEYLEDPSKLISRLKNLNWEFPGFGLLVEWEMAVSAAADRSVTSVYDLSGTHGRQADPKVANIAFNVGAAAVGHELANIQPFHSFSQGMSSVLSDRLDHEAPDAKNEKAWAETLSDSQDKLKNFVQKAKLNSFFNVAETPLGPASTPGMVYQIPDKDILPFLRPLFKSSKEAILGKEFLPLKEVQGNADEIANACKWRFVRLGAPCDFANAKNKVAEGHLSIEVPDDCFSYTHLANKNRSFRDVPHNWEWLFQTPPFFTGNGPRVLVVNLRFRIAFPISKLKELVAVYRLKNELSAEIATHSANFSTRPGISEFR